jgi:hypothetical protein
MIFVRVHPGTDDRRDSPSSDIRESISCRSTVVSRGLRRGIRRQIPTSADIMLFSSFRSARAIDSAFSAANCPRWGHHPDFLGRFRPRILIPTPRDQNLFFTSPRRRR